MSEPLDIVNQVMQRHTPDLCKRRAIVLGGSMAGLLAARVLAEHYQEVTVLERDDPPAGPEQRRGVPQGRHAHGILAGGRRALDALFPGLSAELLSSGALSGDIVRDARWFLEGAGLSRVESGLDAMLASRPLLEFAVRTRVRELSNVRLLAGYDVDELMATPDRRRIIGVRAGAQYLPADLVIDATGRGSRTPRWLEALGYPKPVEERIEIGLGYTTRWFRRSPRHLDGDLAAVIPPTPAGKRGGVMLAQEGGRWIVTLVAHFVNPAPADMDGFIEFSRTLPSPWIHDVIREAEPIGEAAIARFPSSVWRRYDRLERFPEGYLAFGDAISSFNPRYGQGMSVAALQAMELQTALAGDPRSLASRFFARAAKAVEIPWTTAATNDLRMPEARGRRSTGSKFINWYMVRLLRAAHHDPQVALAFHQVSNLMAAPGSVLRPAIARRVFKSSLSAGANRNALAGAVEACLAPTSKSPW